MISNTVTFAAVGDICLSNQCGKQIERQGLDWPFEKVRCIFEQADLLFGNMESVVLPPDYPDDQMDPYGLVTKYDGTEALRQAGFSFMNLAANHVLDGGEVGMFHTRQAIEHHGIATAGVGRNQSEARQMRILENRGLRFGFLCYCKDSCYSLSTAGPCHAYYSPETVLADITSHRDKVDVLVVSVHADQEHMATPSPQRREAFRQFAREGATLVLGHHPHVPQGVELIDGSLIAYSLGNFYFFPHNMPWHKKKRQHTAESFVLFAEVSPGGVESFHRIPVKIPIPPEMRPTPVEGAEADRMKSYFAKLDRMCQDDDVVARNWHARALHNVEALVFGLYEQGRTEADWRRKLLQLIERCLGLPNEPTVDMDRILGITLVQLLLVPENRAWMAEVQDEAEKRWAAVRDQADPYHKPSYRLTRNTSQKAWR